MKGWPVYKIEKILKSLVADNVEKNWKRWGVYKVEKNLNSLVV